MEEIVSGLVWNRAWEVHHSRDRMSTSLDQTICSYRTTPSWIIQLLTFQQPEAWQYREIIASFFLNAFSCHSIETLINLVTIADAIDMGNSHATCVLLISARGRNIGYAIEKRKDSDKSLILLLSIQFLMNMIEWFSNPFIWASVGGLKKDGIMDTSKNLALIRRETLFIVIMEYGLWILRNLCSNSSPTTHLLCDSTLLSLSKFRHIQLQIGEHNTTRKLWVKWSNFSKTFHRSWSI